MDLLALYKAILKSINLHVNKEDMIYMDYDNGKEPIMVKDKRLVLPTRDILREGLGDKRVAFHPISENWLTEGETAVFVEFRKHVTLALTTKALVLLVRLAQIAADTKSHNKLSPAQHEFLSHVPNMDGKAYGAIVNVLGHADIEGNDKLISLYVRKTGQLNGKSYNRLGIVRFPILDQLEEGSDTVFKVKLPRKKDLQTLRALIEYVFPEAENTATYSVGSNDDTAPGFDALVRAFINVARRINTVVKLFRKVLEDGDVIKDWEELLIDVSWEDAMSDLSAYRGQIPNLDAAEKSGVTEQVVHRPAQTATHATTTAPPVADAAALKGDDGSVGGFNIDLYRNQTRPAMAPTIATPGDYNVIPKVESTDGVDFNALRAKNAQTVGTMSPQVFLQPGQPINQGGIPPGYVQTPNGLVPAHMIDPRMMDPRMMDPRMMDPRMAGASGMPVWMDPNAAPSAMGSFPGVAGGGMPVTTMPNARLSTTEQQMMLGRGAYGMMPPAAPPGYVQLPDGRVVPANMVDPRMMGGGMVDPRMVGGGMMVNAAGIPVGMDPRYYGGGTAVNMAPRDPYAGLGINR